MLKRRAGSAILLIAFAIVLTCEAQEKKVNPTLEKGIGQYKHENYDEALGTLKTARQEEPESTLAAYYLGLTYKQLQNDAGGHYRADAERYEAAERGAEDGAQELELRERVAAETVQRDQPEEEVQDEDEAMIEIARRLCLLIMIK